MNPSDEQPPFFVNLHDVETRFSPMSPPPEEDAEESEKATKEVNAEPVYCVCKSTNDQGFMIECDACKDWFHGRCVNMSEKKSRSLKTWLCPSCCPQPGLFSPNDDRFGAPIYMNPDQTHFLLKS